MPPPALASTARLVRTPLGRAALRSRGPAARVLRNAVGRRLRSEERAFTERIEALRRSLESRRDELPFEESDGVKSRQVGELCRTASKSKPWAELLFRLLRATRPERCLELGTCLGISACYQGAALELNRAGRLLTLEGRPAVAAVAADTIRRLHLGDRVEGRVGWFDDVLGGALSDLGRVDHAFIDGHHEGAATLRYFERIRPRLSAAATVVVDDITWSSDMRAAWDEIRADAGVAYAADLGQLGICWCGSGGSARSHAPHS